MVLHRSICAYAEIRNAHDTSQHNWNEFLARKNVVGHTISFDCAATASGKSDAIPSKHFKRKLFISIMRIFATWIENGWRYLIACGKLQSGGRGSERWEGASGVSRGESFDAITPFNLSKHMQRARAERRQMKRANCVLLCVCMWPDHHWVFSESATRYMTYYVLEGTISGKIESTNKGNKPKRMTSTAEESKSSNGRKNQLIAI